MGELLPGDDTTGAFVFVGQWATHHVHRKIFLYVLSNLVHVGDLDYSFDLIGEHCLASPALLLGAVVDLTEEE